MARALRMGGGMNRELLRILPVLLLLGCHEDSDIADESTETGDEFGSPDAGLTVEIMLDGDTHPPTLRNAGELHLQAEADAPSGISVVEFYLDDELISSDELEPYAASLVIPDASMNGERSLTARAYDSNGDMVESSIPLSVELPESGTVAWEYIGPGDGKRWVVTGAEDSALVVSSRELLGISAEGTLLSTHEFTYDVSAVTQSNDGGVIAVGAIGGTLAIERFTGDGVSVDLDLIEEFGEPEMSIVEVALSDDDHLVVSSVHPHYVGDTARISSVALTGEVGLEWYHYLIRESQPTVTDRIMHVAVGPSGAIYTTPAYEAAGIDVWLQLRAFEPNGHDRATFEERVDYWSSYNDVVATDQGVFIAARSSDRAMIGCFDADGEPTAMHHLDVGADKALVLEPVGDDLIYAAVLSDHGTKLGRISVDGEERWSKRLGGGDIVYDIALTSFGHMYVVSEWDPDAWRLRRIHP